MTTTSTGAARTTCAGSISAPQYRHFLYHASHSLPGMAQVCWIASVCGAAAPFIYWFNDRSPTWLLQAVAATMGHTAGAAGAIAALCTAQIGLAMAWRGCDKGSDGGYLQVKVSCLCTPPRQLLLCRFLCNWCSVLCCDFLVPQFVLSQCSQH